MRMHTFKTFNNNQYVLYTQTLYSHISLDVIKIIENINLHVLSASLKRSLWARIKPEIYKLNI